jgi:serine/threonine-protein kinase
LPAALILVIGLASTITTSLVLRERDRERARLSYEQKVTQISAALSSGFGAPLEALHSIPALFDASEDVDRHEFRVFVRRALQRHPSIYALEWIPLVTDEQRDAVEATAQREGLAGFQITEVGPDQKLLRAAKRPHYLPILFMEPPHPTALGFDVASEVSRMAPAQRARDHNATVSSPRIRLVEDEESISSVAVFHPVFAKRAPIDTLDQRRTAFRGLAVVVFHIQPVVQLALREGESSDLHVVLFDEPIDGDRPLLFESSPGIHRRPAGAGTYSTERPFAFADRDWTLHVVSAEPSLSQAASGRSVPLLLGGVGISILLSLLVLGAGMVFRLRRQVEAAQQLGQYTLLEKIGEGGMGVVYKARHAMLRRPTAIKLLSPANDSQGRELRFEREVQLTSRLTHPNTIAVFDYGRTPDGVFYYAMEYLDGITLEDLVREDGPQPPNRVCHLLGQVCGALAEAHGVGLIHRDIKPGNLLLCSRGGIFDFVKVLDFGLVKDSRDQTDTNLSTVGQLVGTPYYLAPEAVKAPEKVDGKADIYALGAVAYFLLTGQRVFEGQTILEVLGQHLHSDPPVPSEALGSPLPQEVDDIVLRCLAKEPEDRPCAKDLMTVLQACAENSPWTAQDAEAWWATRGSDVKGAVERARARRDVSDGGSVDGRSAPRGSKTTVAVDLRGRPTS